MSMTLNTTHERMLGSDHKRGVLGESFATVAALA